MSNIEEVKKESNDIKDYVPNIIEQLDPVISDYNYWKTQEALDYNTAIKNKPTITASTSSLLLIWA